MTAIAVIGGLWTLVNALLAIILNQMWREIRSLRAFKHETNNTLTAVCGALRITSTNPHNAVTEIDDRLEAIERALGMPPHGQRRAR